MWYAADFPRAFYTQHIRPSMVATLAPGGFSGDQNPDHARMSRARRETLIDTFGTTPARWPSPLQEAVRDFHATNVEDNEHHMLIAAAKVGQDMSLAQASWQDQLPPHMRSRSAVDVLRRMTNARSWPGGRKSPRAACWRSRFNAGGCASALWTAACTS